MPRVDCFLLADAVQVVDGKLYILGGGWDHLTAPQFPVARQVELAVRVIVAWTETNRPLQFEVQLETEDGEALLHPAAQAEIAVGRPIHLREGSEQAVPFVMKMAGVPLRYPGRYVFVLRLAGEELARTAFEVALVRRG